MSDVAEDVTRMLERASARWDAGDSAGAYAAVAAACDLARAAGAWQPLSTAMTARAQLEIAGGKLADAVGTALELLEVLGRLGDVRYVVQGATTVAAWFEQAGAPDTAKDLYQRAIVALDAAGDTKNAATTWNNLGLLLDRLHDTDAAVQAMEKAAEGYRALGAPAVANLERTLGSLIALQRRQLDRSGRRRSLEELRSLMATHGASGQGLLQVLGDLLSAQMEDGDRSAACATAVDLEHLLLAVTADQPDGHALALTMLAASLREVGLDAEAVGKLREAIAMLALGSLGWVTATNNLALALQAVGELGEARRLLDEVVDRGLAAEGDAAAAVGYRNRSVFRGDIGDLSGAIEDAQAALARQHNVDPQDPSHMGAATEHAAELQNLSVLLLQAGRTAEAEVAMDEALRLRPSDDPGVTGVDLRIRGFAALALGRHRDAEGFLVMAEGQAFRDHGPEHPEVAACAIDLSELALARGRGSDARNTARRALAILDRTNPGPHVERARALGCLARAETMLGSHDQARAAAAQMEQVNDELLGRLFVAAPDRQRMRFAAQLRADFEIFLSVWLAAPADAVGTRAALERVLRRKALGLEAFAVQRERSGDARELDALRILRRQAAAAMLESGSASDGSAWVRRIDALETSLAGRLTGRSFTEHLNRVTVEAVEAMLGPAQALVELVRARIHDDRDRVPDAPAPSVVRYLAFIVHGGGGSACAFVDLGPAEPIDNLVAAIVGDIQSIAARDVVGGSAAGAGSASALDANLARLGQLAWQPLVGALADRAAVLVAADGPLSLVPLDLVPGAAGGWALDDRCVTFVHCGRDVLHWSPAAPPVGAAVIFGGPDFDARTATPPDRARRPAGPYGALGGFSALEGARAEAVDVAKLLGVAAVTDEAASKAALLAARSPVVLHLATHGFVLPGGDSLGASRPLGGLADNPMLRAGLALAGANAWLRGGEPQPVVGNGIVTAEEVAALALQGTELVVLSACNTGSGAVDAAEGIIGLRRAVASAGARRLVVSSWRVPDRATHDLMIAFYEGLLRGLACAEALRAARQATRARYPELATVACGFMLIGDPSPLRLA